jgi:16S rRNA (guanine(966)-N(2))-methyltransferase RsmD
MRIIGGEFRSRRLLTPKDASTTRPIPDRVKESLFSLLRGNTAEAAVFDAFAGTGAIGLEAISRGASRCVFVERERSVAEILRQNIETLGVEDRCDVVMGDALGPGALARCPRPVNLVFMDPPYPLVQDALGWRRVRMQFERLIGMLTDDGFAVLRTPWPFLVEVPAEGAEPAEQAPARSSGRARRDARRAAGGGGAERGRGRRGGEDDDIEAPARRERDDDDDLEAAPAGGAEVAAPPVKKEPADLRLANAEGPETHVYHNMAVHLYMRRKEAPPESGAPSTVA